jgi:hypothetical protein
LEIIQVNFRALDVIYHLTWLLYTVIALLGAWLVQCALERSDSNAVCALFTITFCFPGDLYRQVLCCGKKGNPKRRPSDFQTSCRNGHNNKTSQKVEEERQAETIALNADPDQGSL